MRSNTGVSHWIQIQLFLIGFKYRCFSLDSNTAVSQIQLFLKYSCFSLDSNTGFLRDSNTAVSLITELVRLLPDFVVPLAQLSMVTIAKCVHFSRVQQDG